MPKKKSTSQPEVKIVRAPIVAVMGHVDHGKTTFLDSIRGARVAEGEAGGITQNTRAHEVVTDSGFRITFIDTPGHEAFSKMRERGAKVTDFVLLIVAADDGVQPQTEESIKFAKKDNVPIIVAINKIDLKGINLQKLKTELSSYGVVVEEYGGDTLSFQISAREKIGLKELTEGIQLLAEMNELKSRKPEFDSIGEAFVLEASLDKRIGNVALCILKAGNLNERLIGVTKDQIFKIRAYLNENQKPLDRVLESQPFWATGLRTTVAAGETIYFVETEDKAKELQSKLNIQEEIEEEKQEEDNASLFAQLLIKKEEIKQGIAQKELNVVVKSATEGTLEAILAKLSDINTEESKVRILFSGAGEVSEDDIMRAKLAKAIILTFQLKPSNKIESKAKQEKVLLRNYEVIYEMFDEVGDVLESLTQPIEEEIEVARAKIKQKFTLSNGDVVYGSEVVKGNMVKGYRIWIERTVKGDAMEIGRGKISSLRVRKDEVKEVKKGLECGIIIDQKFEDIQEGDEIVAYKVEKF
jgi:translation initiation factor IF-2